MQVQILPAVNRILAEGPSVCSAVDNRVDAFLAGLGVENGRAFHLSAASRNANGKAEGSSPASLRLTTQALNQSHYLPRIVG